MKRCQAAAQRQTFPEARPQGPWGRRSADSAIAGDEGAVGAEPRLSQRREGPREAGLNGGGARSFL